MKNKSKKYSKYSTGRVGYSGVGTVSYSTIGFSINTNNYYGDIAPAPSKLSTDYKFIPNGIGITYSKVLAPGIFARVGFNWGRIKAADFETADPNGEDSRFRYLRNLSFRNDIKELSAVFELDLIPSSSGARGRFPINPYMILGVAGIHHAPKGLAPETDQAGTPLAQAGQWVDLHSLGTEGQFLDTLQGTSYSKFQLALPVGFGVKVRLTGNLDLNLEFGLRYLFFDHLDDVSSGYASLNAFDDSDMGNLARAMTERGAEANYEGQDRGINLTPGQGDVNMSGNYVVGLNYAPGTNRGNPSNNDFYTTTAIRIVYILDRPGSVRGKYR